MGTKVRTQREGPRLARGIALFGVSLVVALGAGMLVRSGEPEAPAKTERPLRAARTETGPVGAVAASMEPVTVETASAVNATERELPAAVEPSEDHGKDRVQLARTLLEGDRPQEALRWIEEAVERDPQAGDAHRVHGLVLHTLRRTDEALAAYRTAIELDSADGWARNNCGLLLLQAGRFGEAEPFLESACAIDGGVAKFWNNLGICRERLGRPEAARDAFASALRADEAHARARVSLARVSAVVEAGTPGDPEPAGEVAIGP